MSDPKLIDCPACSKPSLRKQVTAAAFKLNGTGWYETDFKNSGAKPASKPAGDAAPGSDSSASASSASATKSTSSSSDSAASTNTGSQASVASGDTT